MNCCIDCFGSEYLKTIIIQENQKGNCDFCKTDSTHIYHANDLLPYFTKILDLYVVASSQCNSNLATQQKAIHQQLVMDFQDKIISDKILDTKALLTAILGKEHSSYQCLFDNNVILAFKQDTNGYFDSFSKEWEMFSTEIKYNNRFHLQKAIDLNRLREMLIRYIAPVRKGKSFFRARIAQNPSGIAIENMGNPPNEFASQGRANPEGISYLYLGDKIETTLHEVRASLFDYVSVAKFSATDNFEVIDLRGERYDPVQMADNDTLESFMIERPIMLSLEKMLSTPKRRNDKDLDYLPSQYLCEFIKSLGYSGIKFTSSLMSDGYNLAIFEPKLFIAKSVATYEIRSSKLEYSESK